MEAVAKRVWRGNVISSKMDKTVVVEVTRTFQHPLLGKTLKVAKNYKVHDPKEEANVGDEIEFVEGRPVSKTKFMYFKRVVSRAVAE